MQTNNKFNHNTGIVGIIGHPIKHSFSPLMHNIAFELTGQNYIYLPFDVPPANLKDALKGMVALGIKGFNVTIPLKEKISPYLNSISEEASVIGAVNTVVNENGKLNGYNTDVNGVIESLTPFKDEIAGATVSVIGAGGAARSVLYALIRHFKVGEINIINRTAQKAESLKEYFTAKMHYDNFRAYELVPPDLVKVFKQSQLIINTTAVGMSPEVDDSPTMIEDSFSNNQIVFDLIYNPIETKFLNLAASCGVRTVDGLKMFIEQGSKSFELWTGEQMPTNKIYGTLQSYLKI
jgi:shikimate dehydrogenase